jgi:hypothetical protein
MVVAQAVLGVAEETKNPVDYYAGITALCVVILFAKFSTHGARRSKLSQGPEWGTYKTVRGRFGEWSGGRASSASGAQSDAGRFRKIWRSFQRNLWSGLHILCILSAWFAIAVSLFVLGWGDVSQSYESCVRRFVAVLAGMASIILALDVFNQR